MAFNSINAVIVSEGSGAGYVWTYNAGSDTVSDVKMSSYFVAVGAERLFRAGDIVKVIASDGKFLAVFVELAYEFMLAGNGAGLWAIEAGDVSAF